MLKILPQGAKWNGSCIGEMQYRVSARALTCQSRLSYIDWLKDHKTDLSNRPPMKLRQIVYLCLSYIGLLILPNDSSNKLLSKYEVTLNDLIGKLVTMVILMCTIFRFQVLHINNYMIYRNNCKTSSLKFMSVIKSESLFFIFCFSFLFLPLENLHFLFLFFSSIIKVMFVRKKPTCLPADINRNFRIPDNVHVCPVCHLDNLYNYIL